MRRFFEMAKIEAELMIRCIDSIFFGVFMPIGVAILIGMITKGKAAYEGASYTFVEGSFGALITVGICATAFMGIPLTIADYRDKKILKHYFVTPLSPGVILLVQGVVNFALALISSMAVGLVLILGFSYRVEGSIIGFIGAYLLVAFSMYGVGMLLASLCNSIKSANLVCTLVYFPMLFLSGATIPFEIFPKPVQMVANILPLTQGIRLLKAVSMGWPMKEWIVPSILLFVIGAVSTMIAIRCFRWDSTAMTVA